MNAEHPPRVRARVSDHGRFDRSNPTPEEAQHLASGAGALLRATRLVAGMSARVLAEESGASVATISELERGLVRPRPSMLAAIANILDPDGAAGLETALIELAGPSLRPDTTAGLRRRRRRIAAVQRHRISLARQANGAVRQSWRVYEHLVNVKTPDTMAGHRLHLAAFQDDLERHDQLRGHAERIGEHLRRRPAHTPDGVILAVAAFVGSNGRASRAPRVTDHGWPADAA